MFRILLLALSLCASSLSFGQGVITSGTATFERNVSGFDGSPSVNFTGAGTGDYLFEFGWWFRVSGDTQEFPFPAPDAQMYSGDVSTLTWADVGGRGLFGALEICVVSQTVASGNGTVRCTMSITNLNQASPLAIELFSFADFDVNGTPASDSATLGVAQQRIDITDSTAGTAQFAGIGANALMVRPFGATTDVAGLLSNNVVDNLDGSGLPSTNTDVTAGFQWSLNIPAGSSQAVVTVLAANATINILSADLSITKTDNVTEASPGGSLTYVITAQNAGPDAADAQVDDTMPDGLTCTWTCSGTAGGSCSASGMGSINDAVSLPSGGSITYTVSCAISPSALPNAVLTNVATIGVTTAGVSDNNPSNNSATDETTLVPSADLSITKTDGVTTATAGGSTTYTITVSNAGPANVAAANVVDMFPADLTCNWTCVGTGGGTCFPGAAGDIDDSANLPSGSSVTYTAVCSIAISATGTLTNTATVTSAVSDPNNANNTATDTDTLGASANLAITILDSPDPLIAGEQITYVIDAANNGPSNADNASLSIAIPANTTFVSWSGSAWTCTTPNVGDGGTVSCTLASFPNAGTASFTLVVAVSPSFGGVVTATALVSSAAADPETGNNVATTTTEVDVLNVAVIGAVAGSGGGTISCPANVAYGNTTTCTLTPAPGFIVGLVSGCGGVAGTSNPYTTGPITTPCTVTAQFVAVASSSATVVPTAPLGVMLALTFLLAALGASRRQNRSGATRIE